MLLLLLRFWRCKATESSHLVFGWRWARWRTRLPGRNPDEALEQVAGSGVQATTAVVDARPAEGLLALADEHHRSPVPVLVVRVPDA